MALIDVLRSLAVNPNQQQILNSAPQEATYRTPPFAPPQPQQMPQMPQQTQPQGQGGGFKELLLHLGLPLLSTGVGLASPKMLPGAAGFNQGYSPAFQGTRQRDKDNAFKQQELDQNKSYKQERLDIEKQKLTKSVNPPSKQSLLKMAQAEAFRQMGGSAFGGLQMQNPKKKQEYEQLVNELYDSYNKMFIGDGESLDANVDTTDDVIEQEWEDYNSGNL